MDKLVMERYKALCIELGYLLGISPKEVELCLNGLISKKK